MGQCICIGKYCNDYAKINKKYIDNLMHDKVTYLIAFKNDTVIEPSHVEMCIMASRKSRPIRPTIKILKN